MFAIALAVAIGIVLLVPLLRFGVRLIGAAVVIMAVTWVLQNVQPGEFWDLPFWDFLR